jgi:hypothetical protein
MRERALSEASLRRLSAEDLRAMRVWDMTRYLDDCENTCELFECENWHEDNDKHEDVCPWSKHCGHELELHGLALHRGDPTFWERLRKLGVTPEIVAQANAILHPERNEAKRQARPNRSVCIPARHRTRARSRGRRSAPARRVSTASRGSPGDDGPGEPEPARRHKAWHHSAIGRPLP